MRETFFEIGTVQHAGIDTGSPKAAIWNGEFRVQAKSTNASKRFRDGTDAVMLALAEGVSTSPMPHLASQFVVDAIGALDPNLDIDPQTVQSIHGQLCERHGHGPSRDSATTLLAARLQGSTCQVVNVGGSHAYLIDGKGGWTQLSPEDNRLEAPRNCLTANRDDDQIRIAHIELSFNPFDSLLLCSKSLNDVLQDAVIKSLYNPRFPPACQADIWLRAAREAGAPDSLSIVLARLKPRGFRHDLQEA